MKSLETNTVVIGGGPGGYPAAIRLGQLGIDTILVEKNKVGGTCLNVGCIPSKALLNASSSYAEMEKGTNNMGITSQGAEIDWSKTIAWKDQLVGKFVGGVKGLLSANNVQLVNGFGKLLSPTQVQVENEGEEATIINCKNIIISTGSVVVNLPPFPVDNKQILDSTGLLSLTEIPKSLIILGGGVIGMEMGTVYTNLGTKVTIVEMLERILLNGEEEAANLVQR
ncbi:MAG: dihydrolipoamide dehydrogenase, partial [bacterium]